MAVRRLVNSFFDVDVEDERVLREAALALPAAHPVTRARQEDLKRLLEQAQGQVLSDEESDQATDAALVILFNSLDLAVAGCRVVRAMSAVKDSSPDDSFFEALQL